MRIAERVGMTPAQVRRQTTATEFWRWMARFEEEVNEPRPEHFYLAQVASELACVPFLVWGKEPPAAYRDLKTWMLKFGDPDSIRKQAELSYEERRQQDTDWSMSVWLGFAGLNRDGKPLEKPAVRYPPGHPLFQPTPGRDYPQVPGLPPINATGSVPSPDPGAGRGEVPTPSPFGPQNAANARKRGVRVFTQNGEH